MKGSPQRAYVGWEQAVAYSQVLSGLAAVLQPGYF
ncbi:hypothetical protein TIFTF001_001431 [Ficus carica]|uniref:Uncharacterized protein n=1 Tax=Ficus carica TaxID=3494 RepID=A0AA88CR38_FICCA|nr:hypothetical protein TIFTF001_001431 [Ficus carica]